ncbi:MAG: T9SS type A sorting domain-containing protein [Chitinophagaceae bacterium]
MKLISFLFLLISLSTVSNAQCSLSASFTTGAACPANTGSIQMATTGALGSVTYQLNGGLAQSNSLFQNLSTGSYTVIATDASNCKDTVYPFVPTNLSAIVYQCVYNCINPTNCSIIMTATGSAPHMYQYRIAGSSTWMTIVSDTISGLLSNTNYEIRELNTFGCTSTIKDTVINQTMSLSTLSTYSCTNFGTVSLQVNNALNPISYTIIPSVGNFVSPNLFNNVPIGTYTVLATDASNCSVTNIVQVNSPNSSYAITHPTCTNSTNGSIQILLNGSAPYNFSLNSTPLGSTNPMSIPNLGVGNYSIVATDATPCTYSYLLQLTSNNLPSNNTIQVNSCGYLTMNGITYTSSGTYTQTLTNAVGCDSVLTIQATVNTFNPSIVQNGNTLSATQPGVNYQWFSMAPFQLIAGATNQNFNPSLNGNYGVILSSNGCSDTSNTIAFVLSNVSDIDNQPLFLYPNPSSKNINIQYDLPFNNGVIIICDLLGTKRLEKSFYHAFHEISLEDLAPGIYLVYMNIDGKSSQTKLTKQ